MDRASVRQCLGCQVCIPTGPLPRGLRVAAATSTGSPWCSNSHRSLSPIQHRCHRQSRRDTHHMGPQQVRMTITDQIMSCSSMELLSRYVNVYVVKETMRTDSKQGSRHSTVKLHLECSIKSSL